MFSHYRKIDEEPPALNTDESILTKCLFFTSNRLSNPLRKKAEDAFKDLGIGVPYVYMLVVVHQYDGITQSELAEKLDIAPSTCTRFVERLVTPVMSFNGGVVLRKIWNTRKEPSKSCPC